MINELLANLQSLGVAQQNRFVVELFLNPIIEDRIVNATHIGVLKRLMFMAETASLPGRSFATVEASPYGPKRRYPYQHVFDSVNVTFRCSESMTEKHFFDAWQDMVIDPVTYDVNFMNEYASDIIIHQLNNDDRIVYAIRLEEAYPVTINALDLDQGSADDYHKLDVEFSYEKWMPTEIDDRDRFRAEAEADSDSWFDKVIERANIGDKLPNIIRKTF